jgi:hypothetical protein
VKDLLVEYYLIHLENLVPPPAPPPDPPEGMEPELDPPPPPPPVDVIVENIEGEPLAPVDGFDGPLFPPAPTVIG